VKRKFFTLIFIITALTYHAALGGIYIVCDDDGNNPAVTKEHVVARFNEANAILRQAGMHFPVTVDSVQYINKSAWKNLNRTNNNYTVIRRDMGLVPKDDALRIFFVDAVNGSTFTGVTARRSMAVGKNASGITLAHEIGHICGLFDIYDTRGNVTIADAGVVKAEYLDPKDWAAGFYPDTLQQADLVKRLLMYGYVSPDAGYIPHGRVYGVHIPRDSNGQPLPTTKGMAYVGLQDFNRQPYHSD